jgi:hypothetical protein
MITNRRFELRNNFPEFKYVLIVFSVLFSDFAKDCAADSLLTERQDPVLADRCSLFRRKLRYLIEE